MPETFTELAAVFERLEQHYRDLQDIEFTVERGTLWMLQTRSGKRTAKAALRAAVEMVGEGLITEEEAVRRVDPMALDQLLHPTLDPKAARDVLTRGLPASPGAASGKIVFDADTAERWQEMGEDVILVRIETEGHFDRTRRHDQPCGGGRTRHGTALCQRRGQHLY